MRKSCIAVLVGIVVLLSACSQATRTPLALPTSTPPPATPTIRIAPTIAATATHTVAPQPSATTTSADTATASATATEITTPSPLPASPTAEPASPTAELTPPTPTVAFPPPITLESAWSGFERPVFLTYASAEADWAGRLFVVEKQGRIRTIQDGQILETPFLDITDRVGSSGSEQGLLSVAFPPDFGTRETFYVNYTDQRGDTVVARFRLLGQEPPQGDPDSEQKLLEIAQPAGNHNGGQLKFGPDGYLYIGMGDGGRAGDPWGNAQNPEELLGKMLRIDVTDVETYRIPDDNPFADWPDVRPEIWALGLRNPWRFSFDRVTHDLYIADVGQNVYEEIDFQPVHSTGGENYGWDIMEGNHCFEPQQGCDTTGLILPVTEYDHNQGCSVSGGYVYRGTRFSGLVGVYFFGDYCSGNLWGLQQAASGDWEMALLLDSGLAISSFGEGLDGEIYVLDYNGGTVYHLREQPQ